MSQLTVNSIETQSISASGSITASGAVQAASFSGLGVVPSGCLMPFAGTSEPSGWLFCFGQSLSTTTYSSLFSAIGYTYGGSGGSFSLPDLRGRVIAGKDNMGGTSADRLTNQTGGVNGDTLGGTGGAETHQLTETQMPLHGHPFRASYVASAASTTTGGLMTQTASAATQPAFTGEPTNTAGQQIGGTGGNAAHNNIQPTIVLNYIIKT